MNTPATSPIPAAWRLRGPAPEFRTRATSQPGRRDASRRGRGRARRINWLSLEFVKRPEQLLQICTSSILAAPSAPNGSPVDVICPVLGKSRKPVALPRRPGSLHHLHVLLRHRPRSISLAEHAVFGGCSGTVSWERDAKTWRRDVPRRPGGLLPQPGGFEGTPLPR